MLTNKSLTGNEFILKEDEERLISKDLKNESSESCISEMERMRKLA